MNARDHVLDALQHRQPAKVPYDVRFTHHARQTMAEFYGDGDFQSKLGNCLTVVRLDTRHEVEPNIWRDEFGVLWDRTHDKDIGVVVNRQITPETFGDYQFPDPDDPAIYSQFHDATARRAETLVLVKLSYNLFERAWSLMGMEHLLMQMLVDKAFVHALMDGIADYFLRVIDRALQYDVDGIYFADDWAAQGGLLMGPALWREFLLPRVRQMYAKVKQVDKFVFLHCCGKVQELLPDLIECGLDVFNPLQPEVMDAAGMKRRYGDRLSFYGGVSTQQTLPFGTVEATRDEVKRLMDVMGAGGGYIASPAHAIPANAKPENVAAMIEVLQNQ